MIEEQGAVVARSGGSVRVRIQRRNACGTCAVQNACGTSFLERYVGRRAVELSALNQANAAVGDQVVIGIPEQSLLKAAAAAYLTPILALLAGALMGETLGGNYADAASLLGALLGLALAMIWQRRYSVTSVPDALILRRLEVAASAVTPPEIREDFQQ